MKSFKKMITLVASLALIVSLVQAPAVKAEAATPTTWYITYDVNTSAWYGSTDQVNWSYPDITQMKAGDNLVINADSADIDQITIHAPQSIGQLAFMNNAKAVVYAPYVEHAYAVLGAVGVVNSNVGLVDATYGAVIQVNGNVGTLVATYSEDQDIKTHFGVSGTVDKANVKWSNNLINNSTTVYNVAAGKMVTNITGFVPLKDGEYSLTPGAPAVAAPGAAAPSGKQLDAVPKTGSQAVPESALFFGLAAVFAIGAVVYRKKVQQ